MPRATLLLTVVFVVGCEETPPADPPPTAAPANPTPAATEPASLEPGHIYYGGGTVTVRVLSSDAGYRSDLRLHDRKRDEPRVLASNRDRDRVVEFDPSKMGYEVGDELVFEARVVDTGHSFKTGPGERNPDRRVHARVAAGAPGVFDVGFEDMLGGGDNDFNDNVFRFEGRLLLEAPENL